MKHYSVIGFALLLAAGCDNSRHVLEPVDDYTDESAEEEYEPRVDVYFFEEYPNLELDPNGYYHLEIDMTHWQTLHRITGFITDSASSYPVVNCRVEWTSSHYWLLGDTLGYIVRRGLTDDLVYVSYDTSYVTGFQGMEVPTINPASYSNAAGEVNTMIAPVQSMAGDTMTVWYTWSGWYAGIKNDSIKLVLDPPQ